jgi:acetyltransferase-like isoleucine patch superfamily enzyme
VILMGCVVGDHSIIAAGAVLTQFTELPPWSVAMGVPARIQPGAARQLIGKVGR